MLPILLLPIVAAIFAGISATSASFDLFKKWRERRKMKTSTESEKVESSFSKIPYVLRETCGSCLRRAGEKFEVGDGTEKPRNAH